jgi:2-keto-4-pentenoate hydratase
MDETTRIAIAERLAVAERDREPIPAITDEYPDLDVVDAYRIQLINIERRLDQGASIRGHKVGLSSRAMQQMMNVDEPDYGHLLHDMFLYEADSVPAADYCAPRVEIEVAFVLGERLAGPYCTVADVLRATEFVVPAIELIDSRIVDWRIGLADTIADNASSAGVVLGGNPTKLDEIEPQGKYASWLIPGISVPPRWIVSSRIPPRSGASSDGSRVSASKSWSR